MVHQVATPVDKTAAPAAAVSAVDVCHILRHDAGDKCPGKCMASMML